jgi:hypothetical protein
MSVRPATASPAVSPLPNVQPGGAAGHRTTRFPALRGPRQRVWRQRGSALLLGCALAACAAPRDAERPVVFEDLLAPAEGLAEGDLLGPQAADVWVAPVVDATTARSAPSAALREQLYRGLVDRLYTPLSLSFGDRSLAEAGGGPFGPSEAEAVLTVQILGWDTAALEGRGQIDADVELRLLDLRTDPPTQVFGRHLGRRLRIEPGLLRQATPRELEEHAARNLAAELLRELPRRDPQRGAAARL